MENKNPRAIQASGVVAIATHDLDEIVLKDYLTHHSTWVVGQRVYIETPTKYWEGTVVYGDETGVILESVVSVQTTGPTANHYENGPQRAEALPEGQVVAIRAEAIILCAPLNR